MAGILGKKIGMTQVFDQEGRQVQVTAVEAGPCPVLNIRDKSVQLAFDEVKESKLKKPEYREPLTSKKILLRQTPRD